MTQAIRGLDCEKCAANDTCGGYSTHHSDTPLEIPCELQKQLIAEFNALGIEDMEEVKNLNTLTGSYINLEYTLPSGQVVKLLDDSKVYLGNQICKKGSDRCYGLAADENHLLVCEYGENGSDAEVILYKKRNHPKK